MEEQHSVSARVHITMQDVARRAGVSAQTVSNVVNRRSEHVGAETKQRVVDAINELGYRLNHSARSLRRGSTGTVGLGLPAFASEYYGELAERLAERFAAQGVRLVVENTGGAIHAEVESLAASHSEAYDGFILTIAASESADLDRVTSSKPIILLGERALSADFDHVMMDNVGGGRLATAHLLQRGARSIIALGGELGSEESVGMLRTSGYVQAHADHAHAVNQDLIVSSGLDIVDGYRTLTAVIESGRHFDGVFALTDSSAMGAIRALHEHGRRVPVVGFDNVKAGRFHTPSLTTIEPGNDEMADAVVDIMMQRLRSGVAGTSPRKVMAAASLIVRESST